MSHYQQISLREPQFLVQTADLLTWFPHEWIRRPQPITEMVAEPQPFEDLVALVGRIEQAVRALGAVQHSTGRVDVDAMLDRDGV